MFFPKLNMGMMSQVYKQHSKRHSQNSFLVSQIKITFLFFPVQINCTIFSRQTRKNRTFSVISNLFRLLHGHDRGIQPRWLWLPNSSEIALRLLLPGALTWCEEMLPAVMKPTAPINQSACLHLSLRVWMCLLCVCLSVWLSGVSMWRVEAGRP